MPNMSYCRFENTLGDLRDCMDNWDDSGLSDTEKEARTRLLELCRTVVENCADEDGNEVKVVVQCSDALCADHTPTHDDCNGCPAYVDY